MTKKWYDKGLNVVFLIIIMVALITAVIWLFINQNLSNFVSSENKDSTLFNYLNNTLGLSVGFVAASATILLAVRAITISREQINFSAWSTFKSEVDEFRSDLAQADTLLIQVGDDSLNFAASVSNYISAASRDAKTEYETDASQTTIRRTDEIIRDILAHSSPHNDEENIDVKKTEFVNKLKESIKDMTAQSLEDAKMDAAIDELNVTKLAKEQLSGSLREYLAFVQSIKRSYLFRQMVNLNASRKIYIESLSPLTDTALRENAVLMAGYEDTSRDESIAVSKNIDALSEVLTILDNGVVVPSDITELEETVHKRLTVNFQDQFDFANWFLPSIGFRLVSNQLKSHCEFIVVDSSDENKPINLIVKKDICSKYDTFGVETVADLYKGNKCRPFSDFLVPLALML